MAQNCYFFGTFNPPHLGHIRLAKGIQAEFGFEKIIFVPSFCPPHKISIDFKHRYNMLKLCVDEGLGEVSDIESRLEVPSYTFQTVNFLQKQQKADNDNVSSVRIPFIIGYDALLGIEKWKNPEILKQKLEFIVLKRNTGAKDVDVERFLADGYRYKMAKTLGCVDVSSREIREKIKANSDIGGLVDIKVKEYIDEHRLYGI